MYWHRRVLSANPIYQTERLHRRRSNPARYPTGLFGLTMLVVLSLFTVHQTTVSASRLVLLVLVMVHVLHFLASSLSVILAYDSVMRERRTQTWNLLRITPLSIHRVVWGKTQAVIVWMFPLYVRLIGLKLIVLGWQLIQIHNTAHHPLPPYASVSAFRDDEFVLISGAALLFMITYMLIEVLFTAILGVGMALLMPIHWRRTGLGWGLLVRWCLPLLTLCSLSMWQFQGTDPLPTHWNTHLSMAARYTERYGLDFVGYWGATSEVFPSLAIMIPDGPMLFFMHTTATDDISTIGMYFTILVYSLLIYLGLTMGIISLGQFTAHLKYR